jgi:uncharacterized membrane protein (DUF485 family)
MTRKLLWQCNDSLSISIAGIHGVPSIFWLVQMSCTWWVCWISDGHCVFICYNDGKFHTCRKTFQIWVTNKVPALFHRQHGAQKSCEMAQITRSHPWIFSSWMSRPCWHHWKTQTTEACPKLATLFSRKRGRRFNISLTMLITLMAFIYKLTSFSQHFLNWPSRGFTFLNHTLTVWRLTFFQITYSTSVHTYPH